LRFLLPLPLAVHLVLYALENGKNGDILVRKSPASTMGTLAEAMIALFGCNNGILNIGVREGEKTHETLVTQEELVKAEDMGDFFRIENLKKLDYDKFFSKGDMLSIPREGYTSENTKRLNVQETKDLLLTLKEIKRELK